MTTKRISELPAAAQANDTDQFEVNQLGTSRSVTRAQIVSPKFEIDADTAVLIDDAAFDGQRYLRVFCTAAAAIAASLEDDVSDGRHVELVQKGTGAISAAAGSGAVVLPVAGNGNWPAGQHSTTDVDEALVYAREPAVLEPLVDGTVVLADTGDVAMTDSLTFSVTIGNNANRALVVLVSAENGSAGPAVTGCVLDPGGVDEAALTEVVTDNNGGRTYAHVFVLIAPPVGTFDVTISASGNMVIAAAARSYHRCKQSLPTLTASNTGSSSLTISTILNSVLAGSVVVDAVTGSTSTPSLSSDDATDNEFTFASFETAETMSAGRAEKFVDSAGNITRAWTWPGSQARIAIAAVALEGFTGSVWRQVSRPPLS